MWLTTFLRSQSVPAKRRPAAQNHQARRRRTATVKPSLELLEDRTLLSAGALDRSFGSGGKVITDFTNPYEFASAVAVQADGKVVVVGTNGQFALARYNADGSLD